MLRQLPDDINIEDLLLYLPEDSYRISLEGLHKRNSYHDVIGMEERDDGKTIIHIGRNSIYHSLPEFMFHPVNRFDNIPELERKEKFKEECEKQEAEKESARSFFALTDAFLLSLKLQVKQGVYKFTSENKVLQDIIADVLTDEERRNRFIKKAIPFLPQCKMIRGNKTLLTLMLRKIFMDEGIVMSEEVKNYKLKDNHPQYVDCLDCFLDSVYLGNEYYDNITTYNIYYWADDVCDAGFITFLDDLECFRLFIMDYFFSIEDCMMFQVVNDEPALRLSDPMVYNYLNFNTNI